MSLRPSVFLAVWILVMTSAQAADEGRKKPSLLRRGLNLLHFGSHDKPVVVHAKNLVLTMDLAPFPLKLAESRQLKVALALANHSSTLVHLEFPTTQRFDVVIRDQAGKLVAQWSEDQSFSNDAGYVTVNPGERLEYGALISARELKPGQNYTVQGFFPAYDELKIQKSVVPEK